MSFHVHLTATRVETSTGQLIQKYVPYNVHIKQKIKSQKKIIIKERWGGATKEKAPSSRFSTRQDAEEDAAAAAAAGDGGEISEAHSSGRKFSFFPFISFFLSFCLSGEHAAMHSRTRTTRQRPRPLTEMRRTS